MTNGSPKALTIHGIGAQTAAAGSPATGRSIATIAISCAGTTFIITLTIVLIVIRCRSRMKRLLRDPAAFARRAMAA